MKQFIAGLLLVAGAAQITGCAHPMIIKPDIDSLGVVAVDHRIDKNVGLFISPANLAKQVTTKGGGGDKVTYHPYADLQLGLYKVLGDVFKNVTVLKTANDSEAIAKDHIAFVFEPEITTQSHSSGIMTWMATDMTVAITCKITDANGQTLGPLSGTGTGHAEFKELTANFSLAGQRASQDALLKLRATLLESAELHK